MSAIFYFVSSISGPSFITLVKMIFGHIYNINMKYTPNNYILCSGNCSRTFSYSKYDILNNNEEMSFQFPI